MRLTLSEIINQAIKSNDLPTTSGWLDSTELQLVANDAISALHYMITQCNENLLIDKYEKTMSANEDEFDLPENFWKLRTIRQNVNSRWHIPMLYVDMNCTGREVDSQATVPQYRLEGSTIKLYPKLSESCAYEIMYTKRFSRIGLTDKLDNTIEEGWEQFITAHIAAYLANKRETDPSYFMAQKNEAESRIVNSIKQRDQSQPSNVIDVDRRFEWLDPYMYPWR